MSNEVKFVYVDSEESLYLNTLLWLKCYGFITMNDPPCFAYSLPCNKTLVQKMNLKYHCTLIWQNVCRCKLDLYALVMRIANLEM